MGNKLCSCIRRSTEEDSGGTKSGNGRRSLKKSKVRIFRGKQNASVDIDQSSIKETETLNEEEKDLINVRHASLFVVTTDTTAISNRRVLSSEQGTSSAQKTTATDSGIVQACPKPVPDSADKSSTAAIPAPNGCTTNTLPELFELTKESSDKNAESNIKADNSTLKNDDVVLSEHITTTDRILPVPAPASTQNTSIPLVTPVSTTEDEISTLKNDAVAKKSQSLPVVKARECKKVSDFAVPKGSKAPPMNPLKIKPKPKHLYALPSIASTDIKEESQKNWTQHDSTSENAQMPWMSHRPKFDVTFPKLGKTLLQRLGSVDKIIARRIVPLPKQMELL